MKERNDELLIYWGEPEHKPNTLKTEITVYVCVYVFVVCNTACSVQPHIIYIGSVCVCYIKTEKAQEQDWDGALATKLNTTST